MEIDGIERRGNSAQCRRLPLGWFSFALMIRYDG